MKLESSGNCEEFDRNININGLYIDTSEEEGIQRTVIPLSHGRRSVQIAFIQIQKNATEVDSMSSRTST